MPAVADKNPIVAKKYRNKADKDHEGEVVGRELGS